jgi:hypothetical protein
LRDHPDLAEDIRAEKPSANGAAASNGYIPFMQ